MREITSVDSVVKLLGGAVAVGRIIGITPEAIYNWRARGAIPAARYLVIEQALRGKKRVAAASVFYGMGKPQDAKTNKKRRRGRCRMTAASSGR
jgi:hypothetical protein